MPVPSGSVTTAAGTSYALSGGCFPLECDANNNLKVTLLGQTVACPTGQSIDLATLSSTYSFGTIGPCPDNAVMCGALSCANQCSSHGTCVEGVCYCSLLWSGSDCSVNIGEWLALLQRFSTARFGTGEVTISQKRNLQGAACSIAIVLRCQKGKRGTSLCYRA